MQNGFEFEPHVSVQPIGKLVALPPATARRTMIGLCIIAARPFSRLDTPTKWSDDPLLGPGTGLTARRINLLARTRRTPATERDIKMRRTATSLLHRSSHRARVPTLQLQKRYRPQARSRTVCTQAGAKRRPPQQA